MNNTENTDPKKQKLNQRPMNPFFMFLIFFVSLFLLTRMFSSGVKEDLTITNQNFVKAVKAGQISEVVVKDQREVSGTMLDPKTNKNKPFIVYTDSESDKFLELLEANKIVPNYEKEEEASILLMAFMNLFPILLLIGFFIYIAKSAKGGMGGLNSFSKSKAKLIDYTAQKKVTFKDVAGVDESKEDLQEIVEFLKNPKKFSSLGGQMPKGALLVGPPGTGKTLLARAVAGEAGVPFFSTSGSEFIEMFVGVGASRVREMFLEAKKSSPCIIFIDEIDAIGKSRGNNGMSGGNDEREQTLNQILVEMDGFSSNSGVILIAATNRADVLDPALLRPGRFDRRISVPLPGLKARIEILKIHAAKKLLSPEAITYLQTVANGTPGMSGADLENLVNEAALLAAKKNKTAVEPIDFDIARDKIQMGSVRKSFVLNENEKKHTAYHEAGHTILNLLLDGLDPLLKVSIIPRGFALGVTQMAPTEDKVSMSQEAAENFIKMLFGGRLAEKIFFNHYTTGASNDILKATELANRMVKEWGMSDKLGPMNYTEDSQQMKFLGDLSQDMLKEVNQEVLSILKKCETKAKELLTRHKESIEILGLALLDKETLTAAEVRTLLKESLPEDLAKDFNA